MMLKPRSWTRATLRRAVSGASTSERLRVAERRLATTNQWLATRMGLGDLGDLPADPWAPTSAPPPPPPPPPPALLRLFAAPLGIFRRREQVRAR